MISYWEHDIWFKDIDVLIIGSGIVGLSAALHVKQMTPNKRVLVVERGFIPTGASTKNAGFACFGSISELQDDLENGHGEEDVFALAERRYKGLLRLREKLGDSAMGYENYGGFEVFTDQAAFEKCEAGIDDFNRRMKDILHERNVYEVMAKASIDKFGFKGVKHIIRNRLEGQIDTGMMMDALMYKAIQAKVRIVNGLTVRHMHDTGSTGVEVQTESGFTLKAQRVLVCTNGFTKRLFPDLAVEPARNQVLVTPRLDTPVPFKGSFHYDKGYYYFRNIGGNRILLGGGRNLDPKGEATDQFGTTEHIQQALLKLLREMILPGVDVQPERWWSGILGLGPVKKPIVRMHSANIGIAVRMGGMGVAIGTLVGEEGAEMIHF